MVSVDEFSLINHIKQKTYRQATVIKGVGDDAAVVRLIDGDMVVCVDTFVEGVHFTKATLSAKQIGYRLLAVNLSDLAAMGADPLYYLVSMVIPDQLSDESVLLIFEGMDRLASKYAIDLIGGDTVSGKELSLSITIIGSVPKEIARYRSTAEAGDVVFVTGTLGGASAGLHLLLNGSSVDLDKISRESLIKKHQLPEPRVEFAKSLRKIDRVCLNDISDGLANELNEIAESSNVCIEIDDGKIPLNPHLKNFPLAVREKWKYFGGEDFELVGTVSRTDFPHLVEKAKKLRLNISEIGSVSYNRERNGKVYVTNKRGQTVRLIKRGYVHRNRE